MQLLLLARGPDQRIKIPFTFPPLQPCPSCFSVNLGKALSWAMMSTGSYPIRANVLTAPHQNTGIAIIERLVGNVCIMVARSISN